MGTLQYNAIQLVDFAKVYNDITQAEGLVAFEHGSRIEDGCLKIFPAVQLTDKAFEKLFDEYDVRPGDKYDRIFVTIDDVEIFALREKDEFERS